MKKQVLIAFAVGLCLTVNIWAQVPSYVPTNGLVGYWPFNGNANDESGNGNNGTVNGATLTTDRFGVANKAFSFDGVNDFIEIQNSQSLNYQNWTISVWININGYYFGNVNGNTSYGNTIVGKGTDFNSGFYGIGFSSQTYKAYSMFGLGSQPNYAQSISDISLNNWINVVGTWNGINMKIYFNGQLENINNNISNNPGVNNQNLFFGTMAANNLYPYWLNGKIDDIGIWNRALNDCEIQDLYNAQLNSVAGTTISVSPQPATIGSSVLLSTSSQTQNVQWQTAPAALNWQNVPNNANYSGGTTNTLTVSNVQLSNHNQPFRVISNSVNCTDTSAVASIQIADTCITHVTVYDTLYTTVTDTLIINTTLGLPAPNNENTILIYPNPASDHITIDNGNYTAMTGYTIKIENNAGQQVFQSLINQAQFYVDLSTWTGNGLYFVHLIDPQNNTVTVRKIVLQ
jgi:hypothetical protein